MKLILYGDYGVARRQHETDVFASSRGKIPELFYFPIARCCSLSCRLAAVRDPSIPISQFSPRAVVFIMTATAIYSHGHGLHSLAAVLGSTQPFPIRGTAK